MTNIDKTQARKFNNTTEYLKWKDMRMKLDIEKTIRNTERKCLK